MNGKKMFFFIWIDKFNNHQHKQRESCSYEWSACLGKLVWWWCMQCAYIRCKHMHTCIKQRKIWLRIWIIANDDATIKLRTSKFALSDDNNNNSFLSEKGCLLHSIHLYPAVGVAHRKSCCLLNWILSKTLCGYSRSLCCNCRFSLAHHPNIIEIDMR